MKFFIISLLFSTLSFTVNASGEACSSLRKSTNKACQIYANECQNLGACAHRRNTCPASVKTKIGCEGINQCTSDTERLLETQPKNIHSFKFGEACKYHWTTYGSGYCRLYNTEDEFATFPTCPGRRIPGKNNDDVNFDCEAHRVVVRNRHRECKDARKAYANQCSKESGYKRVTSGSNACHYQDVKVFIED
jgi:hypothetical protein